MSATRSSCRPATSTSRSLSLGLGQTGGFDLYGAGAGSNPWMDFNPSIMADLTAGSLGDFDFSSMLPSRGRHSASPRCSGATSAVAATTPTGRSAKRQRDTSPVADFSKFLEGRGEPDDPSRYFDLGSLEERPPPYDVRGAREAARPD